MVGISFEEDLTDAATKLKLIHVPGAGIDAFKPERIPRGCVLCNVFEHEVPIAEYVMLNVLLHVTEQNRYAVTMREGDWDGSGRHDGATHDEAMGKTIGIIGYGHIGRELAKRAKAFDMRTLAVRRTPTDDEYLDWCGSVDELDKLLAESDFVVLALPQTPDTVDMIGEAQLAKMKQTAYLINPARAHIINEKALYKALKDKRIAGAALDAQYQYPPTVDINLRGWAEPFHELDKRDSDAAFLGVDRSDGPPPMDEDRRQSRPPVARRGAAADRDRQAMTSRLL